MNIFIRLRPCIHNVKLNTQSASLVPTFHHNHPQILPRPRYFTRLSSLEATARTTTREPKETTPTTDPLTLHHNLQTYLIQHYARLITAPTISARQKLITSSVYLGTRYEYLIQSHLQAHLGFTLTRIGGKGDGGIDLIGSWTLPIPISLTSPSPSRTTQPTFRILLQAKRLSPSRTSSPSLIRELNGTILTSSHSSWINAAFATHSVRTADPDTSPTDLSHLPTLGILVTTRPLKGGIEKAMASSQRCLMYVCLEEFEDPAVRDDTVDELPDILSAPSTKIRQIVWNAAASKAGLEGYNVVAKYSDSHNDDKDGSMDGEAVMMFQGQPTRPPWKTH